MGKPYPSGEIDQLTLDISALQTGKLDNLYAVSTNLGNVYSITLANVESLSDIEGIPIRVKFNTESTGNVSIKVNNFDAVDLMDYFNQHVTNVRQDLIANIVYCIPSTGSPNFQLLGKGGEGNATAGDIIKDKTATTSLGFITGTATIQSLGGKYYASGTGTVDENGIATVENLSFQPSKSIITIYESGSSYYDYIMLDTPIGSWFSCIWDDVGSVTNDAPVMRSGEIVTYNSSGFSCQITEADTQSGGNIPATQYAGATFNYIAIGQ